MRLEKITKKAKSKPNKGLKFHSIEDGQCFQYIVNAVNMTNVNLICKHKHHGCPGFATLKLGSIAVTPKNPNADRLRFLFYIVSEANFSLFQINCSFANLLVSLKIKRQC